MPLYNPKTVLLMASLLTGLMGATLLLLNRTSAKPVAGLRWWATGSLTAMVAGVLVILRDAAPVWLTYTGVNTLTMVSYTLFLVGSLRYFRSPWHPRVWALLFAAAWLVQAYFTHAQDSVRGRFIAVTGYLCAISLAHAWVFYRQWRVLRRPVTLGPAFTGFWALLIAIVFGMRWVHAVLYAEDGNGMLATNWLQVVYTSSYTFGLTMINIGFELMASERIRARFEQLAMTDTLTGARSRRAILDAGSDLLERSRRSERPFALMLLDLDHFKSVNDQYGHLVGDQVLQAFCARVAHALRRSDVLGRFGGEEFAVLLPDTRAPQARQLADRLIKACDSGEEGDLPTTTVSVGITEWLPADQTLDQLLARADRALYQAKDQGRNRAVVV